MRIMFGNWKYIAKNIWFLLPFAIAPAAFLALSLDYDAISGLTHGFFSGEPRAGFLIFLRAFGFIRIDGVAGGLFSLAAFVSVVVCMSLMLSIVEKHMRIGKRTFSGAFSHLPSLLGTATLLTLLYVALYEAWAVVLSALLFVISALDSTALVYLLYIVILAASVLALLYLVTVFYLWLPCKQITGFNAYDSFLYSYRLLIGVRWRLVAALSFSFIGLFVVAVGASFLYAYLFWPVAFLVYIVLFLGFCIRMETVYFETDKLDREDLIRSYREL